MNEFATFTEWTADEVTIFFIAIGIVWFVLSRIIVRGDGE